MLVEYQCPLCSNTQTRILKTCQDNTEFCDECNSEMEKIPYHPTTIIYKCGGFYGTDKKQ